MHRRAALASLLSTGLVAGCGFQLRQAPHYAFNSIYVNTAPGSTLGNELKRSLAGSGVTVVRDAAQQQMAQVILDGVVDQREKVVVGLNVVGQVRTFQLRQRFAFKLRTPQGKELIPQTEILVSRDTSFSESQALAKEQEDNLIYKAMQTDVVQQLMRRLAAIKSI